MQRRLIRQRQRDDRQVVDWQPSEQPVTPDTAELSIYFWP
jgi:hypothetical protein